MAYIWGWPQLLTKWDDRPSSNSGSWRLVVIPESPTNKLIFPVVTIAGRGLYPDRILQFQSLIQFPLEWPFSILENLVSVVSP